MTYLIVALLVLICWQLWLIYVQLDQTRSLLACADMRRSEQAKLFLSSLERINDKLSRDR